MSRIIDSLQGFGVKDHQCEIQTPQSKNDKLAQINDPCQMLREPKLSSMITPLVGYYSYYDVFIVASAYDGGGSSWFMVVGDSKAPYCIPAFPDRPIVAAYEGA